MIETPSLRIYPPPCVQSLYTLPSTRAATPEKSNAAPNHHRRVAHHAMAPSTALGAASTNAIHDSDRWS